MSTRNLAWGVTGGVSLLLAIACGSTKVHDVGDADEGGRAGTGGNGNVGGSTDPSDGGTGGFGTAGTGYDYVAGNGGNGGCGGPGDNYICNGTAGTQTAGTNVGGFNFAGTGVGGFDTAGTNTGGYSVGGAPATCFEPPNGFTENARAATGPQNAVFVDARSIASDTVRNYADQQVFTNTGWLQEAYANFAASTAANDTSVLLPAQLAQISANVGQFYVARPVCGGMPAAGHKLTLEFWWKVGAVTAFPTHGVALGAVSNKGKAVWFEDSAKTFVKGDAETKRLMNTLNRLVVTHSFPEDDTTDAGKVTLGVWLLPDAEFASTFYIGNVKWD